MGEPVGMARITSVPIDRFLEELWERKGTDLLLTAGSPPLIRVDGEMRPIDGVEALNPDQIEKSLSTLFTDELWRDFRLAKEVDFSFNWKDLARFRGNAFHQRHSAALALRLIPFEIPTMDELGLPPAVEDLVRLPQGLILVTGPTGSGKSTSQAAMLDYINQHRASHILTIEDPIEYLHHHKRSAVNQREIGEDSDSFQRALRSALREDPDVLLVGEMRDLESIATTLTIAETGHLVISTLHTNDTAQALDRIIDVFPSERQQQIRVQVASTLAGIIAQRLLPRAGGGLVAAFEVLVANHAIRNLIREGKTRQIRNVIATSQKEGMQTLEMGLSDLVARGVVGYDEAVSRSLYGKEVERPAPVVEAPADTKKRRGRRSA
jgi:twitching motility protein PilT